MKQPTRVVLLANGTLPEPRYAQSLLHNTDHIIAVNGGTRIAWALQRVPDVVIGDSDSLPLPLQRWLEAHGVPHHTYPAEKDETDLELALRYTLTTGARALLCLGLAGGRLDHTLANLSLLVLVQSAQLGIEVVVGHEHLCLVEDTVELQGEIGETVSVLPWGGDARGVSTEGLKWGLRGETLPFGPARGMSNVMVAPRARISLTAGLLWVCHHRGAIR